MERTLDTVLRSLGNPTLAAGMLSRSPSPSLQTQKTQALINSPSPPPSPDHQHHASSSFNGPPTSPKMHSLPDNALNPLGLLAEASLANRKQQAASKSGDTPSERVGVASDVYFKPGEPTVPISQSVTASRSHGMSRSNDAPPIAATVYRATKSAGDVELCQHGRGRCVVSNVRTLPPLVCPPVDVGNSDIRQFNWFSDIIATSII